LILHPLLLIVTKWTWYLLWSCTNCSMSFNPFMFLI